MMELELETCDMCGTELTKEIESEIERIYGNVYCECAVAEMFLDLKEENKKLKKKLRDLKSSLFRDKEKNE